MCQSAKLIKWVGRQAEESRAWAPGLRENVCRTSVTCWGGAGGSSKTRQIWSRWQPSPHVSVTLFFGAMRQPTPSQWCNVVYKMETLSLNCNSWFFLIKTIDLGYLDIGYDFKIKKIFKNNFSNYLNLNYSFKKIHLSKVGKCFESVLNYFCENILKI